MRHLQAERWHLRPVAMVTIVPQKMVADVLLKKMTGEEYGNVFFSFMTVLITAWVILYFIIVF